MEINCPHCGFSKNLKPEQVPDRPVNVKCPRCKDSFRFDKNALAESVEDRDQSPVFPPMPAPKEETAAPEQQTTCPACSLEQPVGDSCQGCGIVYAKWEARKERAKAEEPSRPVPENMPEGRIVCRGCGAVQSPSSYCSNCGAMMVSTASKVEPQFAGFWVRFVAYFIDGAIVGIVQLVLGFLLGLTLGMAGGMSEGNQAAMSVVSGLLGIAISLSYGVFFIGYCGQTPGKMALRIKVIRTGGDEMTYGRAVLREILGKLASGLLLGIGYLMVAFDSQKQGLHDKIADTYVIKL